MARHLLLAAALGACRADETEWKPDWAVGPNWRHLVDCADWGDDCTASQCCKRPGMQCYGKNEWYSMCTKECAPGRTHDGEEWTCKKLGKRTPKMGSNDSNTTEAPSSAPTAAPSAAPTSAPTAAPSPAPTSPATAAPSPAPTSPATAEPSLAPTSAPTAEPSPAPTSPASAAPSPAPTSAPTAEPSPAPTSPATAAPSQAPTAAPAPVPADAAADGAVESLSGAEPSKRKATSTSGDMRATTTTAASTDGAGKSPPAATTTDAPAEGNGTTARADGCDPCTPPKRTVPDVVIPFWEHDLCKLGYTIESIAKHDPNRVLGTVILMWVSRQPLTNYQEAIDKLKDSLNGSHKVKLADFSQQVQQADAGGWLAQQVFKLKAAALVASDFYVVLDAKNTLMRDLEPDAFFTPCNQGKIYGEFEPDRLPQPHAEWYRASAAALGVQPPGSSGGGEQRWPTSITPVVLHTSTVFDLLDSIHEDRSTDSLCGGPLCEMLGDRAEGGGGATDFTLFVLYARTQPQIGCDLAVEETAKEAPMALSLWRGAEKQVEVNLESCRSVASGDVKPLMFGSQTAALEAMTAEQYGAAQGHLVDIYTAAGLHDASKTSTDALMQCVTGDVEGVAGPIEDSGAKPPEEEDRGEQPAEQGATPQPGSFCCADAADAADTCGTCWPGATMFSDNFCGASESHCSSCKGTWCGEKADEEAPPSEEEAEQQNVRATCEEFKCEGWDESSLCACTASCEQVCADELVMKYSATGPLRAQPGAPSWARAAAPLALLAALPLAALVQRGTRGARRRAAAGRPVDEREALVAPEDPTCLA